MGLGNGRVDTPLSRLKANLWKVSALRGCVVSMGFAVPVLVPYLERRHITLCDVFLLEVAFLVAWLIADCPSGLFADRYGRKKAILAGGALFLGGGIQYLLARTFVDCVICELLLGSAHACIAGAEQALLRKSIEMLHANGSEEGKKVRDKEYKRHWARAQATELGTAVFTSITGVWLFSIDERYPFYAVCAGYCALIGIALSLEEVTIDERIRKREKALAELVRVAGLCLGRRRSCWSICFFALLFGVFQALLWTYNRYLTSAGIAESNLGWIGAVMALTAAGATLTAAGIEKRLGRRMICIMLVAICLLGLFGAALAHGWGGIAFLALLQIARGAGRVFCSSWLEEEVSESIFATAISVQGTMIRLFAIVALLSVSTVVGAIPITDCMSRIGAIFALLAGVMLACHPWKSPTKEVLKGPLASASECRT